MRWLILLSLAACLPAHAQAPPTPAPPAQLAPSPDADRKAAIVQMLDALKNAPTEEAAAPLEAHITELWMQAGSPAVALLMMRGLREMTARTPDDAEEDLDAAIVLQPDFAEAYHQRAIARFAAGDAAGAIADLQQTLQLEPRDFGAFRTLDSIAESREDWKGAFAAWQKLMDIDPKTPGGDDKLKDLRRRALGDET